jgi:uncharacterized damage-inducible protein DinB
VADEREALTLDVVAGEPEVGRWLAALEDCRRDTERELTDLDEALIGVQPTESDNSIATLLYHVALIEADWIVDDVTGIALEESDLAGWFPKGDRDDAGVLMTVASVQLDDLLARLRAVRAVTLDRISQLGVEAFHRPRRRERYDVSPAWVVHHLLQHEAEHRSEIARVRRELERRRTDA